MSCTSPYTVARTTFPLVYPSAFSRNCSRCLTARFITSADCRTKGRISSPAPNLSPTSFIAGSRTSFSVGTAPSFSTARSMSASTPSFLRLRIRKWRASSGSISAVGSTAASPSSSPFDSTWAMKRSSASSRRLKTRSSASSRSWSVLLAGYLLDALGDLHLALARLRHADLVDGQRDERRAVRARERDDFVGLVAAGLEVDGVDDRAAGDLLERPADHVRLGRVDLD